MPDTGRSVFERGQEQGRTDARLNIAEEHLHHINGSIADTGRELAELKAAVAAQGSVLAATFTAQYTAVTSEMQRVVDAQAAAADAAKLVAATLKEVEELRQKQEEKRISPRMRLVSVVAVVASVLFGVLALLKDFL
jgi:hypothetical protein